MSTIKITPYLVSSTHVTHAGLRYQTDQTAENRKWNEVSSFIHRVVIYQTTMMTLIIMPLQGMPNEIKNEKGTESMEYSNRTLDANPAILLLKHLPQPTMYIFTIQILLDIRVVLILEQACRMIN
jgi:hypothetical protein